MLDRSSSAEVLYLSYSVAVLDINSVFCFFCFVLYFDLFLVGGPGGGLGGPGGGCLPSGLSCGIAATFTTT